MTFFQCCSSELRFFSCKRSLIDPFFLSLPKTTHEIPPSTDLLSPACLLIQILFSSRNRRRDSKMDEKSSRSRSVDSSLNDKPAQTTNPTVTSSTDSAVYSMSDISSSISTSMKKPSQSLKDISHFFHYFTLSNDKHKSKTLTNIRRKKLRKKISNETFVEPISKG